MTKKPWLLPALLLALLSAWMALPASDTEISASRLSCNGTIWDEDRFGFVGYCEETTELYTDAASLLGTCDDIGDCGRRISQKCKQSGSKGKSAKLVLQQSGKYTCEGTCEDGTIWVIACNPPLRIPKPKPTGS